MNTKSILKWVLIGSIVVVLNLFFNFAIDTVYNAPEYDKFCVVKQVTIQPDTEAKCVAEGGAWTANMEKPINASTPVMKGWCDTNFTCGKEFNAANSVYNRNVFIALVVLGLLSLGVGMFVTATGSAVSLGLSLGGLLSFIIASMRYWSDMDEYLRVIVLGIALVLLIGVGIKKFKE